MYAEFTKYYLLKDNLNKIPSLLDDTLRYDDSLIFNVSGFTSTANYYKLLNPFIKDRYKIYDRLHNKDYFTKIIVECIYDTKKNENLSKILMCYGLVTASIADYYLIPYLTELKDSKTTLNSALNMVDYYVASKKESLDLTNANLGKRFPDAFLYQNYMEELLHNPLVKVLNLFVTKGFFNKCQKRKRFFYTHLAKPHWYLKWLYKSYDFINIFKRDIKAIDFLYTDSIDTNILNIERKSFITPDGSHNETLDELLELIDNEIAIKIAAINDYLIYKKDKALRKEFDIPKEIEL